MVALKQGGQYLKDFGSGLTDDIEKAHDFSGDEACALRALYDYTQVGVGEMVSINGTAQPDFSPGHDMVWVRYRDCWLAAERQALFLGTRNALMRRLTSTGAA